MHDVLLNRSCTAFSTARTLTTVNYSQFLSLVKNTIVYIIRLIVRLELRARSKRIRKFTPRKKLIHDHPKGPDVTLRSKLEVEDSLRTHPLNGQSASLTLVLVVVVEIPSQPEVSDFALLAGADEDVAGSEVSVYEVLTTYIFLQSGIYLVALHSTYYYCKVGYIWLHYILLIIPGKWDIFGCITFYLLFLESGIYLVATKYIPLSRNNK